MVLLRRRSPDDETATPESLFTATTEASNTVDWNDFTTPGVNNMAALGSNPNGPTPGLDEVFTPLVLWRDDPVNGDSITQLAFPPARNPRSNTWIRGRWIGAWSQWQPFTPVFGARQAAGVADWNDLSNLTEPYGPALLAGDDSNGPGPTGLFHVRNISTAGQQTQFAEPYADNPAGGVWVRGRAANVWSGWTRLDGGGVGLAGTPEDYTITNPPAARRTLPDTTTITLQELAEVVATKLGDDIARGIIQ